VWRVDSEVGVQVALVTGRDMARKPDPESHLVVAELIDLGIDVAIRPWDDATAWDAVPLVVVRTPWDYADARQEFVAWARAVDAVTRLVNPVSVLEWNSHKSYLLKLSACGVPIVATTLVRRGTSSSDQAGALVTYDGELVIKPAVSVGAIGALRAFASSASARSHLAHLLLDGDVLVQPLVHSVLSEGETSLIYFGGEFSHAVRKIPAAGDYRVQNHYGGRVVAHAPTADEFAVGSAALACTPSSTTYARVDLVRVGNQPSVMELEVIEPELFLGHDDAAPVRFAAAISALLNLG
jgi:glutathione synthase/RimK-type ligase-like ATP-grasp enzyme